MLKTLASLVLVLPFVTAAGCGPVTVSATFGEDDRPPRETIVGGDRAASTKVVMIDIRGVIADASGEGLGMLFFPPENPVNELVFRLEQAAKDQRVRAVILRINSPGGTVTASDLMYREVRRFRQTTGKPVVASLGEVAASGGYYLALSADEIVTEPTTVTGSIGVIVPTLNVSEGLDRIGIHARNVKSGPNKDMGDPMTPPVERHYEILQTLVDDFYTRFKSLVVERRGTLKPEQVDEVTDGRIMSGTRAVAAGLADREGGVPEALDAAKRLAGIEKARLVKYTTRGPLPRSPYAMGPEAPRGQAVGGTEINLMQLQIGGGISGGVGPNIYYLWVP